MEQNNRNVVSNNKYKIHGIRKPKFSLHGGSVETKRHSPSSQVIDIPLDCRTCSSHRRALQEHNNEKCDESCETNKVKAVANEVFNDFCHTTSIHGMKFLTGQSHWLERTIWIAIYAFALWFCGSLVWERYIRWERNPVIISFDKRFESISEVPFPAVTICPDQKSIKKVFNYTKVLNEIKRRHSSAETNVTLDLDYKLTDFDRETFQLLAQMCLPKGADVSEFVDTYDAYASNKTSMDRERVLSILDTITPTLEDVCYSHDWAFSKTSKKCGRDFGKILTEDGLCYTYNLLDKSELFLNKTVHGYRSSGRLSSNWTKTAGYTKNITINTYPKRVYSTREKLALTLKLNTMNMDNLFPQQGRGFKIYLHAPTEFPWSTKQYFKVSTGQSVTLTVTPQLIRTSSFLRDYPPTKRECYFNHENPLKYFQVYTKENCELECLADYSKLLCDCVPFWMPRGVGARICGLENFECYTQAIYKHLSGALDTGNEEDYIEPPVMGNKPKNSSEASNTTSANETVRTLIQERRYPFYLYKYRQWQERQNKNDSGNSDADGSKDEYDSKYDHLAFNYKCKCLPACNSINYMADYRTSSFYLESVGLDYNTLPLGYHFMRVEIQFRESQFVPMRRSELYGLYDFVSNFGGLFGLFLGMSLMSIFEVIYFATIRLIASCRSRFKSEKQEKLRKREIPTIDK
ncbi:pickpocket protein 28-like [Culicoides brevitarsis]|uniref:pickpocket protein 28-like n=1 Tax=Culicoides brevitarsis TaxID=469753 RepID=UPI00307B3F1B